MEINIFDYITREQIIEECVSVLRKAIAKDAERILTNMAYQVMFEAVDKSLDGQAKEFIKQKTLHVIKDIASYTVFRKANAWEHPESLANSYMEEAIRENKQVIFDKVKEIVNNFNYEDDFMRDLIVEGVIETLKGGR